MKDFIRFSKILLKRNALWLTLLFFLVLLVNTMGAKNEIEEFVNQTSYQTGKLQWIYENKEEKIEYSLDESYGYFDALYEESSEFESDIKDKLHSKEAKDDIFKDFHRKYTEILDYYNIDEKKLLETDWSRSNTNDDNDEEHYQRNLYQEIYNYQNYMYKEVGYNPEKDAFNFSGKIANPTGLLPFVIVIIGFLFTSLDHLTSYYEFTRILPWKKEKSFIMKIVFGSLIVIGVYLVLLGINYMTWSNSAFGDKFVLNGIFIEILKKLGIYFSILSITMAVGEVSGNVLGHAGLLIIVLSGFYLIEVNILTFINMFKEVSNTSIVRNFNSFIDNNNILKVIYFPLNGLVSNITTEIITFFAVGIVFLGLGILFTRISKAERSGMLIQNKYISKYAEILAIISTANLLSAIFGITMGNYGSILRIAIFVIVALLSYKFYKLLFNVRVGI